MTAARPTTHPGIEVLTSMVVPNRSRKIASAMFAIGVFWFMRLKMAGDGGCDRFHRARRNAVRQSTERSHGAPPGSGGRLVDALNIMRCRMATVAGSFTMSAK